MSEREKIIEELGKLSPWSLDKLSNFILANRRRIVEPLVNFRGCYPSNAAMRAIDETLKNAGVTL